MDMCVSNVFCSDLSHEESLDTYVVGLSRLQRSQLECKSELPFFGTYSGHKNGVCVFALFFYPSRCHKQMRLLFPLCVCVSNL